MKKIRWILNLLKTFEVRTSSNSNVVLWLFIMCIELFELILWCKADAPRTELWTTLLRHSLKLHAPLHMVPECVDHWATWAGQNYSHNSRILTVEFACHGQGLTMQMQLTGRHTQPATVTQQYVGLLLTHNDNTFTAYILDLWLMSYLSTLIIS